MRNIRCDEVRELLPELDAGRLSAESTATLRSHIASCESCLAEAALITRLRTSAPVSPDGLHAKVMEALGRLDVGASGARPPEVGVGRPRLLVVDGETGPATAAPGRASPRFGRARRWALAASVTIMVAAGAVVWRISSGDDASLTTLDTGTDAGQSASSPLLEWPAGNGVVAGGAVLDGLSDDQLQTLLEEMQS